MAWTAWYTSFSDAFKKRAGTYGCNSIVDPTLFFKIDFKLFRNRFRIRLFILALAICQILSNIKWLLVAI
jgi:hypothetical protein